MKRVLRVIEYTGTDEFLRNCIERRAIKDSHVTPSGTIREALIGDWPEILWRATSGLMTPEDEAGEV